MNFEKIQSLLSVNIDSLVKLTRLIIPSMKTRGQGHVVNIASVYAYVAVPHQTLYAATKAFVKSFSLGLAAELKHNGIGISCVCPGSTQTQFHARINKSVTHNPFTRSADSVAQSIYKGVKKRRLMIVPAWYNRVFVFLTQLIPTACLPSLINLLVYRLRKWRS